MPTPPRTYETRTCPICRHTWTPERYRAAARTTCSRRCARTLSARTRTGKTSSARDGRLCARCGTWKPHSAYCWKDIARGRRQTWCRPCMAAYNAQYRAAYRDSLNAQKRRTRHQWRHTPRAALMDRHYKRCLRLERAVERARACSRLVGAYFRAVKDDLERPDPNHVPQPDDKEDLHLWARQCLAWLLRTHVYLSWEQIGAALRRPVDLVRRWVALVRRRIRQSHWTPLAGHAQALLEQAREMHPSAARRTRQGAAGRERQRPTDIDAYWAKRRAHDARERRYG